MKTLIALFSSIVISMLLVACDPPPPTPTPDPILPLTDTVTSVLPPTDTPLPVLTDTPISADSPTPTATLVPVATNTPESPPTPMPSPTPFPTPDMGNFLIRDFQTCDNMGSTSPGDAPNSYLDNQCEPGAGRGNIIARLDFNVPIAWAGFRIGLDDVDFSQYDTLTFFARGDADVGVPPLFRLEIKRADGTQVGIFNLAGLTGEWERYSIPLKDFDPLPDKTPICGWDSMEELVFVFESEESGEQGRIFLDNVSLEQVEGGAPEPPADCPQITEPPLPLLNPNSLLVADFCSGTNNLDGAMGAAYEGSNILIEGFGPQADRSCAARLEYNIQAWAAFWMKLQGQDLTPYSRLTFDIRGDSALGIPGQMKIELKRAGNSEVSIVNISGITDSWQTRSVNLENFSGTLSSLTAMEELVFTFEVPGSGNSGVVYLDQVQFQP